MRLSRSRYLAFVAVLLVISWLGYMIGYLSPYTAAKESLLDVQGPLHETNKLRETHFVNSNQDNIIMMHDPPDNAVNNKPGDLNLQALHQSHAGKKAAHIHPIQPSRKSNLNTTLKVKPSLKEEKKEGVEWQHLDKIKENQLKQIDKLAGIPKDKNSSSSTNPPPPPPRSAKFDPQSKYYSLIHDGKATKVHGKIHDKIPTLPDTIPREGYVFEADQLPTDPRLHASIGNGNLATVVHGPNVLMNGLYNGLGTDSHRAVIPSTCSLNVTGTEPSLEFSRTYSLNVAQGIYSEISKGESFNITQRVYAHRNLTNLLVVEIDLERLKADTPQKLIIKLNRWGESDDLTFVKDKSGMEGVSYKIGHINAPETLPGPRPDAHVLYDKIPDELVLPASAARVKWVFLTAIAFNKEDVYEAYNQGAALIKEHDALYAHHVHAWAETWERARIDVVGNLQLARAVYGSLYYILSSMPIVGSDSMNYVGLSPSGLPYGTGHNDYRGHVFWDQETWMYPPILMFRPDLAKTLLYTRKRTQDAAAKKAKADGHQGLEYPWESAMTGVDVTPAINCSLFEQHINGDISLSIVQYLYATNDTHLIEKEHFDEIITGIANFWVSRLLHNQKSGLYEIHNVMPPDESAINVNNSVYTNEVARLSLSAPEYIYKLLNKSETHWKDFAEHMYIPFDATREYHPEFDGYKFGRVVKQADVVMLGFPLQRNMPVQHRINDLKAYGEATDKRGPAMTWPMYCIGWLEVKEFGKAAEYFKKNFDYIQKPFQVWTEQVGGDGATNFITGMGGFLQNVIFGYGGFRLRADRLDFDPVLPPNTTETHYIGVTYLGNVMNMFVSSTEVMLTVTSHTDTAAVLHVQEYASQAVHDLNLKTVLNLKLGKYAIFNAK